MKNRVEDVVELRLKDGQSFINYRDSLNRILKEYKTLDRKVITEIQRDIIEPELHSIERTISLNKSSLYTIEYWKGKFKRLYKK